MPRSIPLASTGSDAEGFVAPGVYGMRNVMVNLYALTGASGSWVLIDAGLYFSAKRIKSWAEEKFGAVRPSCILLTHGHFDHIGSLRELAGEWDVPVYAHSLEMPYITGRSKYAPPEPAVGRGAMAYMAGLYPRGPIDISDHAQALPLDGTVPNLPDWRWIHTPGHTPGHVSFFRDEDRVLIAGDAFVTTRPESFFSVLAQRVELNGPPRYYTSDWEAAKLSVQRLADLQPVVLATGHGLPLSGPDATDMLDQLAFDFDYWARPHTGRYAHEPAFADERGLVSVPPAISNPMPKVVVASAVGGLLVYALSRRRTVAARN
jgi:glyoxylase-like metal-dependent hydrolase (beta-lactamase superfamily II)